MPELIPAVPLSAEWHAARRGGVTATDIVTILGLSSWDSVYSLFWRKLQQAPEQEDNDRLRLGRELEHYIATRWSEERGRAIVGGALYRIQENQELRGQVHDHMMTQAAPLSEEWEADSRLYASLAADMDELSAECMRRAEAIYA